MKITDFEAELKKLDDGFSILPNPNRQGLANIFYRGRNYDLPVVSSYEIKEEPDPRHTYEFPNGMVSRLWSKSEIMPRINQFLEDFKSGKIDELYN